MTIDEAISHALEVAEQEECFINYPHSDIVLGDLDIESRKHYAAEQRQLAAWLTELKELKETKQNIVHAYWIRGKEYGFRTHNSTWYCSNCGGSIRYDTTPRTYQKQKKPVEEVNCFCRKCGAKMDLEPIYERGEINNENH